MLSFCLLSFDCRVLIRNSSNSYVSCKSWSAFPFALLPTEPQAESTLEEQFPSSHFDLPVPCPAPPPCTISAPAWQALFPGLVITLLGGSTAFPTASLVTNSYLPEQRAWLPGRWSERATAVWWSHVLSRFLKVRPLVPGDLSWKKILLTWFSC